jgi:hypothetical protein
MNGRQGQIGTPHPMSIGSLSFWQQDQNFWYRAQTQTVSQARTSAVISAISSAMTNESQGLASLANRTALTRVNTQLSAAIQNVLSGNTSGSASSSSSSSSSGSSPSSSATASSLPPPPDAPASGTGSAPLLTSTSLITLGILKKGQVTVYDGSHMTSYTSTGNDTVGDLINAINANKFGNANVAAGLNADGRLTITAKDSTSKITIGGAFAPNIGFGGGNDVFSPTPPPASAASKSASSTSTSATSSAAGTNSSTGANSSTRTSAKAGAPTPPSGIPTNSSFALLTGGTAAMLLASNGGAGSVVNLLA